MIQTPARTAALALATLALASSLGCSEAPKKKTTHRRSDTSEGTPGGGGGNVTGTSAPVTLTVASASLRSYLDGWEPQPGRVFWEIHAELVNASVPVPLPVASGLFSLETAGNLRVGAAGASSALSDACDGDLSVAAGGALACGIVFEVPQGDAAAFLHYDDPAVVSIRAAVPAPEQACLPMSAFAQAPGACLQCLFTTCEPPPQECYDDPCIQSCGDCACEDACSAPACASLPAFRDCAATLCAVQCSFESAP